MNKRKEITAKRQESKGEREFQFLSIRVLFFCSLLFFVIHLSAQSTSPSKIQKTPDAIPFSVPSPKLIPDKKGIEQQHQQSESFFKWIDPKKATQASRLQVDLPDFAEQIHYLGDEKNFTHLPRASVLRIPQEGKAKRFFKSQKEIQGKTFIPPERFIQDHQNQFEKVEADNGKAPSALPESKEKILVLYSFGKVVIP